MVSLTPRRHELLSVYLLGVGTLFLYLGYVVQAFIGEAVIKTIHSRNPDQINVYAGYYGQAFHYAALAISSLFTPYLQYYLASKWILTIASGLFAIYYLGFIHVTSAYFYLSQVLMGIGYSLYNNGEGAYLSEHSSRRTIESNTGIETAVGHSSMFVGGIAMFAVFYFTQSTSSSPSSNNFTDSQIHVIYAVLFMLNLISVLIFAFLPTKQYDSIASKSSQVLPSIKTQFKNLLKTVYAPDMLVLIPFFLYMGVIVTYLMAIFSTSLAFSSYFANDVYIIAIYSTALGVSEIFGGIFLRPIIKRQKKWGLVILMAIHFLSVISMLILSLASVPNEATIRETIEAPLLLAPSRYTVSAIGLLIGMGDFSITMSRAVICQLAVPENRMEVFALSRIWQCVSASAILGLGKYMTMVYWVLALVVFLVIGCISFVVVAIRTNNSITVTQSEKEITEERI